MRNLQAKDVFVALRLAKAMGIKELLVSITNSNITNPEEMGYFIIGEVLSGLANPEAEHYFYEFMGNILELDSKQVEEMGPMELLEKAKELKTIISGDDWKTFFKSVMSLMK